VRLIGYKEASAEVEVATGQVAASDFAIEQTALRLQDIVVTGVVGETPRVKLPFTVERIESSDIPVPAANVSSLLTGKAPGVTVAAISGQPGGEPAIRLRGPTSVNADGRSQSPLIVVDGVIQADGAALSDINTLDIESVEIVKGAAASSLYGSRAQAGVIQITTKRGTSQGSGGSGVMVRAEYGISQLIATFDVNGSHPYLMNEAGTKFIDTKGNEIDYADFNRNGNGGEVLAGGTLETTFWDQAFPGPLQDPLDRFYDPGETTSVYGALTGQSQQASYRVSFERFSETGIVDCGDPCKNPVALENFGSDYEVKDGGFERWNARLNFDAQIGDLGIAASGFYSTSSQDDVTNPEAFVFFDLAVASPFVDLATADARGLPAARPDPLRLSFNPLYSMALGNVSNDRTRTMGSVNLNWTANDWVSFEANASFDRTDRDEATYWPRTFADFDSGLESGGFLGARNVVEEAANASLTASFARSFLEGDLTTRARVRVLGETQSFETLGIEGVDNEIREIQALGYFGIVGLDYKDRYIVDGLIRRDGSSLFGPDQRWHTYVRGSAAWRLTQEDFWSIDWIDELKLRFSYGTAGGRPNFFAQYEAYEVEDGLIFPGRLGNRRLRPELSTEREAGLNLVLFGNLAIDLTYASNAIDDQILVVPLPAFRGFTQQWQNAGELQSNTWEASLRWAAIDSPDLGLAFRLNWDRTDARISRMDIGAYKASGFWFAEGEVIGSLWGGRFASSCLDVVKSLGMFSTDGFDCGQFQVNDDGHMVFVGQGNDWTQGIERSLWGTEGEVAGETFAWGFPIQTREQSRICLRAHPEDREVGEECPLVDEMALGNTQPDWNGAFATTFRYKGLTASALMDATIGFDLVNHTHFWRDRASVAGELDQEGKPNALKKPLKYYGTFTGLLNGALQPWYMESGGWVKLREVAVAYTFPRSWLQGVLGGALDRVTLSFIGRNLLTITDYSGLDPETGFSTSEVGSATIDRWDSFQYPNSRTFSLALEVVF
jgi:TonB-linked SusC/RagA family outer membrane protein